MMITSLKKLAKQNRNYYLSEMKADDGANPWYRYVKTMDSYSEPVMVSPKMARELYVEAPGLNYPTNKAENTVSISFSGKLLSGRAALMKIISNKKSDVVFISFNVSDKLGFLFG